MLYLGLTLLLQGRMDDVLGVCYWAAQHLAGSGDDEMEARIHLLMGKVFYERNDLERALDYQSQGISLRYDPAPFLFEGFTSLAYIHLARGNETAAGQAIEQSIEWIESKAESFLLLVWTARQVRAHQARLWLLQGNVEAASAWVREIEGYKHAARTNKSEPPIYVREWEDLVLARAYLAEHRAGEALALLEAQASAAESGGRVTRVLEILVLQAIAHDAVGNTPAALLVLERAVELGASQQFVRTFVDGGPPILRLLAILKGEIRGRNPHSRRKKYAPARYMKILLAACTPMGRNENHLLIGRSIVPAAGDSETALPIRSQIETLTAREFEVMRLIIGGASNNDIARQLVIAPATAKRHVSNILMKLNVRSRTQAVARIRGFYPLIGDEQRGRRQLGTAKQHHEDTARRSS
jgi:LuxR family maltose regulon positive regulatory protein